MQEEKKMIKAINCPHLYQLQREKGTSIRKQMPL